MTDSPGAANGRGSQKPMVVIDAFPETALAYRIGGYAVVAVDVLRATTTAITAFAAGRRCFTAPTVDAASLVARNLINPIMAGEIGGNMPFGFEMNNSPAEMAERTDVERPVVLVTSSGTLLMHNASQSGHAFLACLRNVSATVSFLAERYSKVAVIGAGSRGEFREEDQYCCALVAAGLVARGHKATDRRTADLIEAWTTASPEAWLESNSVRYLLSSGQERDLEFVKSHRDDLDCVCRVIGSEILDGGGPPHPPEEATASLEERGR